MYVAGKRYLLMIGKISFQYFLGWEEKRDGPAKSSLGGGDVRLGIGICVLVTES